MARIRYRGSAHKGDLGYRVNMGFLQGTSQKIVVVQHLILHCGYAKLN